MLSYSLVLSRGYVRPVRQGELRSRRWTPTSLVRRGNEWVEAQPDVRDMDQVDRCERNEEADVWWVDEPEPRDPVLEAAMDEARHPQRGDAGQSARSRMNMRRLFVSLPRELVDPCPALISLTYPALWQLWVPDGRSWEAHRRRSNVAGSAAGVRGWSGCG